MKEIIYSDHARKRMKQRGVEEWEVEHIIKYPSYVIKVAEEKRVAFGEMRNRKLKIVFIEGQNYKKVITIL